MNSHQKSNVRTYILLGCGVFFFATLAIVCSGVYYIYHEGLDLARRGLTDLARESMTQIIDESKLPKEQKSRMQAEIDRVADGFKTKEITLEQLGNIFENIGESPAITGIPVEVCKYAYIEPSGLVDEEKAESTKQLQRVMRGMFEKKIAESELDPILEKVGDKQPDGKWVFQEKVTDNELRGFVEQCKILADEKQIADERYDVDLAEELKKAIDHALEQ